MGTSTSPAALLRAARESARLTEAEVARRAGTSQSAVSVYESGHKSPTLRTLDRLARATGHTVTLVPRVEWTTHLSRRGRPFSVPSELPRLPVRQALALVHVPGTLMWSGQRRDLDLSDRADRIELYRTVLVEGTADDIARYVDGVLLVDVWGELLLPPEVETAWRQLIRRPDGAGGSSFEGHGRRER